MSSREKKRGTRSPRKLLAIGAVSLVTFGALIAACGLDDSVVDEMGQNSGANLDATLLADGAILLGDGNIVSPDGATVLGDADADATIHVLPDSGDTDDADLSDAAVADGGCAAGTYMCTTGAGSFCLGSCSTCPTTHDECELNQTCVSSCSACGATTECFRGVGDEHCVQNPAACAALTGTPTYCGPFLFFTVDCPGNDQVCVNKQCLTCGESGTLGNKCDPSSKGECKGTTPLCQ
jgi:hypothetical protein